MITVVMSTYNGSEYLVEQLDSIRNQTKHVDEVIIADDCSTDNTFQIIKEYVNKHALKWKYYKNKENYGWRKSFSMVLALANGEYVFPADQDDVWKLDKIEIMTKAMEDTPDCKLLCGNYKAFSFNNLPEDFDSGTLKISKVLFSKKWSYIQRPGCVFCCKKDLVKDMCNCWIDGYAHDVLLWQLAVAQNALYVIDYNVIYFRRHDHNATPQHRRDKITRLNDLKTSINHLQALINFMTCRDSYSVNLDVVRRFRVFEEKRYELIYKRKLFNIFWLFAYKDYYPKGVLSMGVDLKCALS